VAEEVGGFFASLKLNTDEASFSRGAGKISDLAGGLKGLLLAGAGLAGLTLSFKALIDAASEQAKLGQMAMYLGMSADNLQNWRAAIRTAGSDADSFVAAIGNLNAKMVGLRAYGEAPNDKFWIAVHGLGVDPNAMLNMSNDQRVRALMQGAEKLYGKNPQNAQRYLEDTLGKSSVDLLLRARQNKTTVSDLYNRGASSQYTTGRDMQGAAQGVTQWNQSVETLRSVFNLFSDTVMKNLAPSLKGLNDWLLANKDEITQLTKALADFATAVLQLLGSAVFKSMDMALNAGKAAGAVPGSVDQRMASINMSRSAQALTSWMLPKALNEQIKKALDQAEADARAGKGMPDNGPGAGKGMPDNGPGGWGAYAPLWNWIPGAASGAQRIIIEIKDRTTQGVQAAVDSAEKALSTR
jgi:hypothetical protein